MTPERWRQVTRIYGAVMTKPPAARAAALAELCPDDEALRKEVESLLADDSGAALLDRPIGDVAASVVQQDLAGRTLGPYRLEAAIGAGGMGQVYRANDTRLHRTVAVKVLAPSLAHDPQFHARFDREAKAIAALNHPHICTLHDIGSSDGVDYLVMEYVGGETLSTRLERGALPFDQALTTAIQIADALAAAHRQGIVHRDLKPGNIMLTKSGVKLLDFGLAKPTSGPSVAGSLSMLPTTPPAGPTRGAPLTMQGMILGTLQYMAPEQLEGKEADARTDIFAFGAIVYEMITGKKSFNGASQASLIAAIMHVDPPALSALAPLTPATIDHIVGKCIAKDPEDRWQSARDLAIELRWATENQATINTPASEVRSSSARRREIMAWVLAGVMTAAAIAIVVRGQRARIPTDDTPGVVRSLINVPEDLEVGGADVGVPARVAVSPDGRHIVFPAIGPDHESALWVRSLDSLAARRLENTTGVRGSPFWAPDSQAIAFFAGGKLKRIDLDGGPALTICTLPSDKTGNSDRGGSGSWSRNGAIVIVAAGLGGTFRTSVNGEAPTKVAPQGELPEFLPDGVHFLYRIGGDERATVFIGSIDGEEPRALLQGVSQARYARGHLLFTKERTLFAQPFDSATLKIAGDPTPIDTDVLTGRAGNSAFSAAPNVIAYVSDREAVGPSQLVWLDRDGRSLNVLPDKVDYRGIALSHGGSRIAASIVGPGEIASDIWLLDSSGSRTRFTSSAADDETTAVWSNNDETILFGLLGPTERRGLYQRASGLGSPATRFLVPEATELGNFQVQSWSRDGRWLIYGNGPTVNLWLMSLEGDRKTIPFMQGAGGATRAQFSPDGSWIAYQSRLSGRDEIYLAPAPGRTGHIISVSNEGGSFPRWSADGKELFYLSSDLALMSVAIQGAGDALRTDTPRRLFPTNAKIAAMGWPYDVSPDGRFLFNMNTERSMAPPIRLIMNWAALMRMPA